MTDYIRPSFKDYCSTSKNYSTPQYPYSVDLLKEYDIFDLFVLDGGAFFFIQEHLGGKGTDLFLSTLESGKLIGKWQKDGEIDWMVAYNPELHVWAPDQTVEEHVWMNRLYFLLPIAQQYLRVGDSKWINLWYDFFKSWIDNNPPPEKPPEDPRKDTCFVWHDMQITWRLLVLINSVFLLGQKSDVLSKDKWAVVYNAIETHAKQVYAEAKKKGVKNGRGNHFLQKGAVLIYAGLLYPEFENASDWAAMGRQIVIAQMKNEIYADGGSVEASPSYSHFIARQYVDTHLILKANKKENIDGIDHSIKTQYEFLAQTASPDWKALQIGDSYPLDAKFDIEIVNKVFPLSIGERKSSVYFKDSQFGVLRNRDTVVYVDAMPGGLGHIHRGKPNILLYYKGRPVLVDAGCVNYDRRAEHHKYFKTRNAHNVVIVEPVEDDEKPGTETIYKIKEFTATENGGTLTATCQYTGKGAVYEWQRVIILAGDSLEIKDSITSTQNIKSVLHMHFAQGGAEECNTGFVAKGTNWQLTGRCLSATGEALKPELSAKLTVDDLSKEHKTPAISFEQLGGNVQFITTITIG